MTQTTQELSFDGPFSITGTIAIAIVVLILFGWSLYRERQILGTPTTVGFFCLRLAAMAMVFWMLLSPVDVRVQTSSTRRAIVIVTDTSASMRTVDPVGTADEVRWADVPGQAGGKATDTGAADRASAALEMAHHQLAAGIQAIHEHRREGEIADYLSTSQKGIQRAIDWIATLRDLPLSNDAWRILHGPDFESFAELVTALAKGKTPVDSGWHDALHDLDHQLLAARNVASELSRQVSADETDLFRQSMVKADNHDTADFLRMSRGQRVERFIDSLHHSTLAELADDVDVQWGTFDESYRPSSPGDAPGDLRGQATDVSTVLAHLRQVAQTQPIAATFLFSDVAHNGDPLPIASSLSDTPVYVIPIGNSNRLRDIDLVAVEAPPVAMRNDEIVIQAHVQAYQCEGDRCMVELMQNGAVVDFRAFEMDADFVSRAVRFEHRVSEIGQQSFEISVAAIDGELTDETNFKSVDVNVTRTEIKVLLADEMPRWEFRYLAQLFRRDPKVDCDEMLFRPRLIATGHREDSETFPVTVDQWDRYDVVILGDLPPERLSVASQESLIEYLRQRGGTLITIAGGQSMPDAYSDQPLAAIIPVTKVEPSLDEASASDSSAGDAPRYAFHVTDEGKTHVALMIGETQSATRLAWDFVNRFSPLDQVSAWRRPKPSAKNLIGVVRRDFSGMATDPQGTAQDATEDTFLCWQTVGRGRIVYLSGPDTYRLRFLRGDELHFRFWGQLMRWAIASDLASGSQFVQVRASKARYKPSEPIRVEVELLDTNGDPVTHATDISLRLHSSDDDRTVPLMEDPSIPGVYVAEAKLPRPGAYTAKPIGPTIDGLVGDDPTDSNHATGDRADSDQAVGVAFTVEAELPRELIDTRCDRALASQIASLTGAQVLAPSAIAEVLALTDLTPIITETVERRPLWVQWKYLWLIFGCLLIEWIIRKNRGLS